MPVLRWVPLLLGLFLHAGSAVSEEMHAYYRGKEVRILVGYAAGGGYDSYARAVAQVLGKHLPGHPSVIVQNMPGGDGLAVANYMARLAPRDGTSIAVTNRNLAVGVVLGLVDPPNAHFDPTKFRWLANLNSEVSVLLLRSDLGIRSIEELRGREVVVGATGSSSNNAIYPYVANNLLGTRLKVVAGYPGTSHLTLALEKGEIGGIAGWAWSSIQVQRPDWITEKKVVPVLQIGLSRIPELNDVPLITDLATTEDVRRALELVCAPESMGRPFFAPPETSAEVTSYLREGFAAMAQDPAFLGITQRARLDVTFTEGSVIQDLVARLNGMKPEVIAVARKSIQRNEGDQK